jgi:hypothetical protein
MIELRGIIQYYDKGHKYVDIVVRREHSDIYETHRVGIDIPVNKGRILSELTKLETDRPAKITWPHHIEVKDIGGPEHGPPVANP